MSKGTVYITDTIGVTENYCNYYPYETWNVEISCGFDHAPIVYIYIKNSGWSIFYKQYNKYLTFSSHFS